MKIKLIGDSFSSQIASHKTKFDKVGALFESSFEGRDGHTLFDFNHVMFPHQHGLFDCINQPNT